MKVRSILLFVLFFPLVGCDAGDETDPVVTLPSTNIQIGNRLFVMEKATTFGQQERGLMRRDSLAEDRGMIFIFSKMGPETFWNHDVRFPLDVVFLDDQAKVVSIQQMKPYDDTNTQTIQAQYVIELNKGTADKIGLKLGDQIALPADAKAP